MLAIIEIFNARNNEPIKFEFDENFINGTKIIIELPNYYKYEIE
jgi:hypothetical protein